MYQRLGVTIVDRGESFYQEMMKDVVRELDDKGKSGGHTITVVDKALIRPFC